MDARIDPVAAFGIELGDAHVIRNVSITAVMLECVVWFGLWRLGLGGWFWELGGWMWDE